MLMRHMPLDSSNLIALARQSMSNISPQEEWHFHGAFERDLEVGKQFVHVESTSTKNMTPTPR